MSVDPKNLSEGARRLRVFLDENGLSIQRFCIQHCLDRVAIQRVLKGERGARMGVELAADIEDATAGAVPMRSWRRADHTHSPAAA